MVSSISCTYDMTSGSRRLSLRNMVTSTTSGSSLSFTVYPFVNPYNGAPKTGFTLYTADSNGYYIDSKTSLTVTATNWASFDSAFFERVDDTTTVDELSYSYIKLGLTFPVDMNCLVNFTFPSEMPFTSDVSSVSGLRIFD